MKRFTAVAVILIALLLACPMVASAQEEPKPTPKAEANTQNWYRIDVSLNEFQDGKKISARSYTLQAGANSAASEMKLGDRVPVAVMAYGSGTDQKPVSTQFQYLDVGLYIDCRIWERSGLVGLSITADQSSIVPSEVAQANAPQQEGWPIKQPFIRQLKMGPNWSYVSLGKPTLIASVDDPSKANHKYTLEATVAKINP